MSLAGNSAARYRRAALRLLPVLLLVIACAPPRSVEGRPYGLSVPANADPNTPLPLVVLLHGYGVNAEGQDLLFGFSGRVDARGFIYAQPNGTIDSAGKRFWNATDACCNYDHRPVDDAQYLREVIADVEKVHPVDPTRVFLVGHSNGAFMALRMACDAGERVRAVVALAGSTWLDPTRCGAGLPVSVLQVHGTADATIGYSGGSTSLGAFPSARATSAAFAAHNGCSTARTQLGTSDFIGGPDEETTREAAAGCPDDGRVELWTLEGAGHIPIFNDHWREAVLDWLGVGP